MPKMPKYHQDKRNANKGTDRGRAALKQSLERLGAGRSVLVDKHNVIIAGNKTMEAAEAIGMSDNTIVVETTGDKLVVVKRMDLDLEAKDVKAIEMSLADNRVAQLGLDFDLEILKTDLEMLQSDFLDKLWTPDDLGELFGDDGSMDIDEAFNKLPTEDRPPFYQMTFTLHDSQVEEVKKAILLVNQSGTLNSIELVNKNNQGNALHFICKEFLNGRG